jgi:hypothetical protein
MGIVQLLRNICVAPLFAYSILNFRNHQIVVVTTVRPSRNIRHQAHLYAISYLSRCGQFDCFSNMGSPIEYIILEMWKHCTFDKKILGCGKV